MYSNVRFAGHCGKMMAIIHRFQSSPELRERVWLVITDDDTLLRYTIAAIEEEEYSGYCSYTLYAPFISLAPLAIH